MLKLLLVLLTVAVYATTAKPTFDVLYKIAGVLENELIDSHGPNRDHYGPNRETYRTHQPEYGPPAGNGYYPTHSHAHPTAYPGTYVATYPGTYPSNVGNPISPHYHGLYPAPPPPHGQYPATNFIQGSYGDQYPGQLGSNGYGAVSGSNSYGYGSNSGYKRRGY